MNLNVSGKFKTKNTISNVKFAYLYLLIKLLLQKFIIFLGSSSYGASSNQESECTPSTFRADAAAAAATGTSTSFRAAPSTFRTEAAGTSASFRAATFKTEHLAESN